MKIQFKRTLVNICVASALLALNTHAYASERESVEEVRATTLSLIELLVEEGVLSKEKAEVLIKKALAAKEKATTEATNAANIEKDGMNVEGTKPIRVQYVPEHVKKEMRAQIEQEVMKKLNYKAGERLGLPEWIDRVEWTGELRLRYQSDQFSERNATPGVLAVGTGINSGQRNVFVNNSTEDRERHRVRALFGANIHVNDWLDGGIRFTTGLLNTPITPNQTEGFSQGKYVFGLDRAFLQAKPNQWLTLTGGRMANSFYSTDLVWDPDLALDGLSAQLHPKLNDHWKVFSTVGAFPIDEIESSDTNKAGDRWMYAAQAGLEWTANNKSRVKLGAAYYDFKNVEGQRSPLTNPTIFASTAPNFVTKGNSTFGIDPTGNGCTATTRQNCGIASQFQLINFTGEVDVAVFDPVHVILQGDYVKNIGFDKNEIKARTTNTYAEENEGYQVSLMVGYPRINKLHDWQVFGGYKRLEADAVLDGFTDSNFHLGGTDAKGYFVGGQYGIGKNAWLSSRWISTDSITGLPFAIDTFFIDLNARF